MKSKYKLAVKILIVVAVILAAKNIVNASEKA